MKWESANAEEVEWRVCCALWSVAMVGAVGEVELAGDARGSGGELLGMEAM